MSTLNINWSSPEQRVFYYATARNQLFSGGFNNGKSFVGSLKLLSLLTTYPNYRVAICRQVRADLMKTTYQTFHKLCPKEYIERSNEQEGITVLKNKSLIFWLHLDKVEESTLRGLEINSVLTDQAEEIEEKVYDVLDARVGRWDDAIIPIGMLEAFKKKYGRTWPQNELTGKYLAPSYHLNLCNPDTQYHFLYKHYHPESPERKLNHFFVHAEWNPKLGSKEAYTAALSRGGEYVSKYVLGQWGISNAQIHRLLPASQLEYSEGLINRILTKGNLFRSMDHGESAPTCCLWWASLDGVYICYREYYVPGKVISEHRRAINDLSEGETYTANYADPSIFAITKQREGGFFSVADEYMTADFLNNDGTPCPPLFWQPADNNEFATRNRINELLSESNAVKHPIDSSTPAPRIYYIKRSNEWPYGCHNAITQLGSQRRKLIGYEDGTAIYSDDRADSVTDHAYDPTRYFIAMHGSGNRSIKKPVKQGTFNHFKHLKNKGKARMQASPMSS